MGIVGLTDREELRFPRIGVLRKGSPKNEKGQMGRDLRHFRFTPEGGPEAPGYQEMLSAFERAFGPEPTEVPFVMPYATVEENFSAWREEWAAGGLVHRCDGRVCVRWYDKQTGQYRDDHRPCPDAQKPPRERGCKQVGRLAMFVVELGRFAQITAETHSINDIANLHGALVAYEGFFRALGHNGLQGKPFVLSRRPIEIGTPSDKGGSGRGRRVSWLLAVQPDTAWVQHQLSSRQAAALPSPLLAQLPAPDEDDEDDETATLADGRRVDRQTGEIQEPPAQRPIDRARQHAQRQPSRSEAAARAQGAPTDQERRAWAEQLAEQPIGDTSRIDPQEFQERFQFLIGEALQLLSELDLEVHNLQVARDLPSQTPLPLQLQEFYRLSDAVVRATTAYIVEHGGRLPDPPSSDKKAELARYRGDLIAEAFRCRPELSGGAPTSAPESVPAQEAMPV